MLGLPLSWEQGSTASAEPIFSSCMMFLHFSLYHLLMKGLQKLSSNPHVPSFLPPFYRLIHAAYKHVLISFILKDFTFPSIYITSLWVLYHRIIIVSGKFIFDHFYSLFYLGENYIKHNNILFTLNNGKVPNVGWMLVLVQTFPKCSISDTTFNAHNTLTKMIISFGLWLFD